MNTELFLKINSWTGRYHWLDRFMVFSADWLGYLMVLVLLFLLLKNWRKFKNLVSVAIGSALTARIVFVSLIRFFYYHPRPFMVLQNIHQLMNHETESSFPSGYAAFYFALATGVYLYNKKAGIVFLVLAGLIGFARIFVSIHWPLDILAGAALGIATAVMLENLRKRVKIM